MANIFRVKPVRDTNFPSYERKKPVTPPVSPGYVAAIVPQASDTELHIIGPEEVLRLKNVQSFSFTESAPVSEVRGCCGRLRDLVRGGGSVNGSFSVPASEVTNLMRAVHGSVWSGGFIPDSMYQQDVRTLYKDYATFSMTYLVKKVTADGVLSQHEFRGVRLTSSRASASEGSAVLSVSFDFVADGLLESYPEWEDGAFTSGKYLASKPEPLT